ncbi:putative Anticodon-binding domain, protein Lsm12 [Helianthus annuus]|nr:putative Anticodon-binding domain, protein Lsm12 [Helianthus annuus]
MLTLKQAHETKKPPSFQFHSFKMDGSSGGDEFAVGCLLSIKTTFGDEFEGQIITYDRPSNILVLQEGLKSNPQSRRNIRLLKANYIKEFSFLGQSEDPLDLKKCYLDLHSLQSKEDAAVRQAEIDVERIGVGVTAEAQSIFDALSKTLPVRWDKTVIVVMNEVRVSSPYLAESVTGGTPAANERVRKVLELERRRLQTRGGGQ